MDNLQKFTQWINHPQCTISPKLEIKSHPLEGNSVYAVQNIVFGERLLNIPHSLLLNYVTILKHLEIFAKEDFPILQEIKVPHILVPPVVKDKVTDLYEKLRYEDILSLTSFQLVSLYIVTESLREENSFWEPFLKVLPSVSAFSEIPFTWLFNQESEEFFSLPESTKKHAKRQYEKFNRDFEKVSSLMPIISKDKFLWAWLCCNTRCLYMELDPALEQESEDSFTMAPYVDFLNHSPDEHCTVKIKPQGFQVYSGSKYSAGDQIYLRYGPHSNEFLGLEYGFTLPDNPWNSYDISPYVEKLLKPYHKSYLEREGYLGSYVVGEEMSFRIEVALACAQESEKSIVAGCPKLKSFINGYSDGGNYREKRRIMLQEILDEIIVSCEDKIESSETMRHRDLIQLLNQELLNIAYNCEKSI